MPLLFSESVMTARLSKFVESTFLKLVARVVMPAVVTGSMSIGGYFITRWINTLDNFGKGLAELHERVSLEITVVKASIASHDREDELKINPLISQGKDHETRIRTLENTR